MSKIEEIAARVLSLDDHREAIETHARRALIIIERVGGDIAERGGIRRDDVVDMIEVISDMMQDAADMSLYTGEILGAMQEMMRAAEGREK